MPDSQTNNVAILSRWLLDLLKDEHMWIIRMAQGEPGARVRWSAIHQEIEQIQAELKLVCLHRAAGSGMALRPAKQGDREERKSRV